MNIFLRDSQNLFAALFGILRKANLEYLIRGVGINGERRGDWEIIKKIIAGMGRRKFYLIS